MSDLEIFRLLFIFTLLPFGLCRTGFASSLIFFTHPAAYILPFPTPMLGLVKTRSRTAGDTIVHIYLLPLAAIYLLPVPRLVLSLVHFIRLTTPTSHSIHLSLLFRLFLA